LVFRLWPFVVDAEVALMVVAVAALSALVAGWYIQDLLAALRAPTLGPASQRQLDGPLVSVVIPARDEARRIASCLAGLAEQSHRRFEVIVVDDNSSDETAAVARGFAGSLPALRVIAGAPLPNGWAGKCWACWQGACDARGELLLFLDADVTPRPELLAAMAARVAGGADLLTLVPLVRLGSLAERAVLPSFVSLISSVYPFERVNDPRSPEAFAIGQCLMLRRASYEAVDGHRAVRGSVLEDVDLARLVKSGGWRLEALTAPDLIEVRMYAGWGSLSEGLTKNAVAGFRSGEGRAMRAGLRQLALVAVPFDLLAAGGWLLWSAPDSGLGATCVALGLLLIALGAVCWGWTVRRRHRIGAGWGLLFPLGTALYYWLAARALLRLRSGRGVLWKGRVFTR
jgi:chlorobactene glucosyltransferase